MRVSKEKAAQNRDALLQAASQLFREHGIDGVGVADIARAAGLTHGALYAHFPSKEALAAAALGEGLKQGQAAMQQAVGDAPSLAGYLDFLFSPRMRDSLGGGCALAASASEIGRQGEAVCARFTQGFLGMAGALEATLDPALPAAERQRLSYAVVAAQIGAIAAARGVAKTDPALADAILGAVRGLFEANPAV